MAIHLMSGWAAILLRIAEQILQVKSELEKMGHQVFFPSVSEEYKDKSEKEIKKIEQGDKIKNNAIRKYWENIKASNAILVLNYDKKGIKNYIGGSTFMEISFAYILDKKIFLLNPIPEIEYYKSEIEAVGPIIINGDFSRIE